MMKRRFNMLLSLVMSFFVNLRLFGIKGIYCPILIKYNIKVNGLRRNAVECRNFSFGAVSIGFGGTSSVLSRGGGKVELCGGKIIFEGSAKFSEGIVVKNKGILTFGDAFSANKNCTISCTDRITIGKDCLLGWNIHLRDSDGHTILENGEKKPTCKPVYIGIHVWIASECHILKGVSIPDECVIGYRSLVTGRFDESKCIIAGHPAEIVKRNIAWEK